MTRHGVVCWDTGQPKGGVSSHHCMLHVVQLHGGHHGHGCHGGGEGRLAVVHGGRGTAPIVLHPPRPVSSDGRGGGGFSMLQPKPAELLAHARLNFLAIATYLHWFVLVPWVLQGQRVEEGELAAGGWGSRHEHWTHPLPRPQHTLQPVTCGSTPTGRQPCYWRRCQVGEPRMAGTRPCVHQTASGQCPGTCHSPSQRTPTGRSDSRHRHALASSR